MSDNSAYNSVLSNFEIDVLDPNKIKPIKPLEPVKPLEIKFVLKLRPLAIEIMRSLEKQYKGHWFVVMPHDEGWQLVHYDTLSPQDKAWADEARGLESYYE